jgi:hypothetical protein
MRIESGKACKILDFVETLGKFGFENSFIFSIRQQQLQKIFSLLNENKDAFGQVTHCDVMKQMELYQAKKP